MITPFNVSELNQLFSCSENCQTIEYLEVFEKKSKCRPRIPTYEQLYGLLTRVPARDTICIEITMGGYDCRAVTSKNLNNLYEVIAALKNDMLQMEPSDEMQMEVRITKCRIQKSVSIYDLNAFRETLLKQSLEEQIAGFARLGSPGEITNFVVLGPSQSCASSLFTFSACGEDPPSIKTGREEVFQKHQHVCHFQQVLTLPFIPDDFQFFPKAPEPLVAIFEKVSKLFAVAYICDRSRLDKNLLSYHLKGYKTVSGAVDLSEMKSVTELGEVYALYAWMYSGGAISDKAGLLRNLLSLEMTEGAPFRVAKWIYSGVLSNYEIYLRKNVSQYLESKSKMESAVADLCGKLMLPLSSFASGLKGNLAGFCALFTSVVVANALKSGSPNAIFTEPIVLVGAWSVVFSSAYLVLCVIFLHLGTNHHIKSYERLKARYSDILVKEDIVRILADDEELKAVLSQVRIGFYSVVVVWILMLIGILLILLSGEALRLQV